MGPERALDLDHELHLSRLAGPPIASSVSSIRPCRIHAVLLSMYRLCIRQLIACRSQEALSARLIAAFHQKLCRETAGRLAELFELRVDLHRRLLGHLGAGTRDRLAPQKILCKELSGRSSARRDWWWHCRVRAVDDHRSAFRDQSTPGGHSWHGSVAYPYQIHPPTALRLLSRQLLTPPRWLSEGTLWRHSGALPSKMQSSAVPPVSIQRLQRIDLCMA